MSEIAVPRLHLYMAREAPLAVVLRRGPSDWVRLSVWHTDTDTFDHGQWMRARVYELRCDASPDGALFAYFAAGNRAIPEDGGADTWIAVSRPPYFTALALWWLGGTYCAGAMFPDRDALFVGGARLPDKGGLPSWLRLTTNVPHLDRTPEWTDRTVFFSRLLRDGWTPPDDIAHPRPVWEYRSPDQAMTVMMALPDAYALMTERKPWAAEYALRDDAGGDMRPLGLATWAGWDARGRLALAREGALWAVHADGALECIENFTGQQPSPEASPAAARVWPRAGRS
jgi:hypothetical protein